MKVYFVTREGYRMAGCRVRCHNFSRALGERGLQTEVISYADDFGAKSGEREREMGVREKAALNLRALKRLASAGRGDVIVCQRLNYHAVAPYIRSFRGARFVFDCDDWDMREDPVYHFGFWPSSKMEFLTRCVASRAFHCIAASRYLQEYLGRYSRHVAYVPTGVDTDAFLPGRTPGQGTEFVFSWVGTAYHREMGDNLRFIIDCFSRLASRRSEVRLELAGEGKYYDSLREDPSLPCRDRIVFRGWVLPDDMPALIARVDAGLLPLVQGSRFNRAKSPTKLFEYMACARPTVSSRLGEAAEAITDGVQGFLAAAPEEFTEKMERLVSDRALCARMGESARERAVSLFSLRTLGDRLYEVVAR